MTFASSMNSVHRKNSLNSFFSYFLFPFNFFVFLFFCFFVFHHLTGDTSIIGAGTYANDRTCAVSATGKGEEFMRYVAAYDVSGESKEEKKLIG